MRYLKPGRLYCFSPLVMLVTFLLETVLAVYVIFRYKLTPVSRLAVAVLVGLATFQLAEYNICEAAFGIDSLTWARIGYVAITLLPPLGLHLALRIADDKRPILLVAAYASAAVFSAVFLFVEHGLSAQQCLGNYVIFRTAPWAVMSYAVYYYGWLMLSVGYAWRAGMGMTTKSKKLALYALVGGYISFIIPTTVANLVDPTTLAGIPSIMCGFALVFAVILVAVVLPQYNKKLQKRKKPGAKK